MAGVLEGILGANFGFTILTMIKVIDPVVRGVTMGSSAHALGTAAASLQVPFLLI